MSAAENKALMERIFTGLAVGDGAMFVEHLADEVTLRVTGQYSWSRTYKGKASVLRDVYGYVHSLTEGPSRTIAFRFIADGDHVVVEARGERMTKKGARYDNDYCLIYRLADGKIVEMTEYQDSALCEAVLGPSPYV
jgi:ketosteroid isomerase-like protein